MENINYVELTKKFIDEHNNNINWSPFDRIETTAIVMYTEWLESYFFSLKRNNQCSNEEGNNKNCDCLR